MDTAWQLEVSRQLGALLQQTTDLTEQVRRQNGNVARLWTEMDTVKEHPARCPLNLRVAELERAATAINARSLGAEKATAPWRRWAERLAFALLGSVCLLLLLHAAEMLKVMKG